MYANNITVLYLMIKPINKKDWSGEVCFKVLSFILSWERLFKSFPSFSFSCFFVCLFIHFAMRMFFFNYGHVRSVDHLLYLLNLLFTFSTFVGRVLDNRWSANPANVHLNIRIETFLDHFYFIVKTRSLYLRKTTTSAKAVLPNAV